MKNFPILCNSIEFVGHFFSQSSNSSALFLISEDLFEIFEYASARRMLMVIEFRLPSRAVLESK